jgi:hypothetical protein
MSFQSNVNISNAFGVPGELLTDSPHRADSLVVNSAGTNPNVVGNAFTKSTATNVARIGGAVGAGVVFAGLLANPKVYAHYGKATGTLSPTLALPDNANGEFVTMGDVVVQITGTANIGDVLLYDTTTGELSAMAPGGTAPAGSAAVPNAVIWRYPVTTAGGGLTVARLTN